jgi:S-DNA-T family DNA segregation ATPase FtsK/SpoIIIE
MVLGAGARKRGALADQIPASLPGVGYMVLDQRPEPVRVRFTHVTDDHIRDMNTRYATPTPAPTSTAPVPPQRTAPAENGNGNGSGPLPVELFNKLRGGDR